MQQLTYNQTSLQYKRLKDILPALVDEETGIISYIRELPRQFDMPDFIYYKAEIADTGIFGQEANRPTTGGTSLNRDKAIAKALGEAVERYCSAIYHPDELPLSSFENLNVAAVPPVKFDIYTPEQIAQPDFPFSVLNEQTLVRWTKAVHLTSGNETLVPAAFVYCPYRADRSSGEEWIAESISTGLAAHCSFEEAAVNAVLEVVERDSFMLHWYAMVSCPVIDPESLTSLHREMIDRLLDRGYKVDVLLAEMTEIPTVFCMMHGMHKGTVPFVVSAATHLSPVSAIDKCLEELALMERLCKRVMLTSGAWRSGEDFGNIVRLIDHLKLWLNPEVVPQAGFMRSGSRRLPLDHIPDLSTGSPGDDLAVALDKIEGVGYEVYISDVTTQDISTLGMSVVRAVIPGYVPLTIRYRCRPEGSARLQRCIRSMREKGQDGYPEMNPLPHPFA